MPPHRLRRIITRLYPGLSLTRAVAMLARDILVGNRTVWGWLAEEGNKGHHAVPEQTAALLERAYAEADRLRLWERPEGGSRGLLIKRI